MKKITIKNIVKVPETTLFRKNEKGEVSIIKLDSDSFFSLSHLSAKVFLSFNGRQTLEKIVQNLAEEESVPVKRLQKDTLNLVEQLVKEQLIELK